jgi:hypothetical protein
MKNNVNPKFRKLGLNRETIKDLTSERLSQVAGATSGPTWTFRIMTLSSWDGQCSDSCTNCA